jgi:RHS repeat-associated protein
MKTVRVFVFALLLFSLGSYLAFSQTTVATGTYPYGTFVGGPDKVNLGNLNVNWQIPIVHKAGRGTDFVFDLVYDSSIWYPATSGSTKVWTPGSSQWGWSGLQQNVGTTYYTYTSTLSSTSQCPIGPSGPFGPPPMGTWYQYSVATLTFVDEYGVPHSFPGMNGIYIVDNNTTAYGCPYPGYGGPTTPTTLTASDGSNMKATYYQGPNRTLAVTITKPNGDTVVPTDGPGSMSGSTTYSLTDRNGNQITGSGGVYTDTLGQTALTVVGTGGTPPDVVLRYTDASGGTESYTVNYSPYTVQTNFGCSGVTEYLSSSTQYLVTSIQIPDGRHYSFTYEATPGHTSNTTARIASVTLPTGGTIDYTYTGANDGANCTDGTTMGMTRQTPDASDGWSYQRSGSGTNWTTTTTNPSYNSVQDRTVSTFLTTAATSTPTYFYETKRQVNAGTSTLLETVLTCYEPSGSQANCSNTAGDSGSSVTLPLSEVNQLVQYPDSTGIVSGSIDQLDTAGNLLSQAVYDYGVTMAFPSAKLLQTTSWGWLSFSGQNFEVPTSVTVKDGAGTKLSETDYVYDNNNYSSPPVTATSGTPHHVATSGARGNVTSVSRWVSGTTFQSATYTYFDTGNVQTQTDFNGTNVTTNTYGACGNSFLTGTSTPVKNPAGTVTATLTTSAAWNCVGGVQTSTTDYNGNTTNYNYGSDPYWRPVSSTDAGGNTISYSYPSSSSANTSSVATTFNSGSSIVNVLTMIDGLGRTELQQRRQGPSASNYDSVATSYDTHGRKACQTMAPYSATLGSYTAPASSNGVCTSYDPLDRPSSVSDPGNGTTNGTTTYTYTPNSSLLVNSTLAAAGPAPSGENTKRRLLSYNGAGQLTSVCEVTTLTGSGSCGAGTGQTGYLTQYTYDGPNLTRTQQNVQAGSGNIQTRTIGGYDGLGRIVSETIPEWSAGGGVAGTTSYVYDSDSTCGSTSAGDLIKKTDNAGNVICNTYDSMHRLLTSQVISGPYASSTPASNFVYDAATYGSTQMQNAKGNLAEAYTGTSSAKITDEFFSSSYSTSGATTGGVIAQVWQSTPHSGGYFLTSDTFYPNGVQGARSTSYGAPSVSYVLDGEGRPITATDTTHSLNLVTSASYNPSGSATGVGYGNGDSDSFTYSSTTNRLANVAYSIAGGSPFSITTALTWNPNASLQQMQITDTNDSTKNQTCAYAADDLRRIASVNCGTSTWAQNFSYDAFGNINKANAGNATSYVAAYSAITNQVTGGPAYDGNGNQLSSTGLRSINWNAAGNAVTVTPQSGSAVSGTYDAVDRLVETSSSSGYSEFVYGAAGDKAAAVSSGTLQGASVMLPGGETAVYNASGLNFIRHTDWLGSSRLATTWAHTVYSKESYAPFGETYSEAGTPDRDFTGHDQSEVTGAQATGTYETWFRKYDPAAGRWLSPDPLGWGAVDIAYPQSLDRYAYVSNRPLELLDPYGLEQRCNAVVGVSSDGGITIICPPDPPSPPPPPGLGGGGPDGGQGKEKPKERDCMKEMNAARAAAPPPHPDKRSLIGGLITAVITYTLPKPIGGSPLAASVGAALGFAETSAQNFFEGTMRAQGALIACNASLGSVGPGD